MVWRSELIDFMRFQIVRTHEVLLSTSRRSIVVLMTQPPMPARRHSVSVDMEGLEIITVFDPSSLVDMIDIEILIIFISKVILTNALNSRRGSTSIVRMSLRSESSHIGVEKTVLLQQSPKFRS